MKALNHKLIIKNCNLACIVLTAFLIILQFVPYLYNVDGRILTRQEYKQLYGGESVVSSLVDSDEVNGGVLKEIGDILAHGASEDHNVTILDIIEIIEAVTHRTSIASIVWKGPFLGMQRQHVPILLFGVISIILSIINMHGTLNGILPAVVACFGVEQAVCLGSTLYINLIVSVLIIPFALVLCAYHIWKMYTWFTVEDSKYRSMWGLR